MSSTGRAANPSTGTVKRRRGLLGFLIALTIVAGLVVFALAAAGVGYAVLASRYDKAERAMDAGQYAKAMEHITNLPAWFEEADEMLVYTQGCAALAEDDFANASHYFTMAGAFRDAEDRAAEANYLLGCWYLDKGDGNNAKTMFREVLAKAEFSKSEMLRHTAYLAAVRIYDLEEYTDAREFFQRNPDYLESSKFLTLLEAHLYLTDKDSDATKKLYDQLAALDGFHNASALMGSDVFLPYYLLGKWKSDGGLFQMEFQPKDDGMVKWSLDTNLPLPDTNIPGVHDLYFHIDESVMYASPLLLAQGVPAFQIKVLSVNEMQVYCTENNSTYTMKREQ